MENLHAVSQLKHETFTVLEYSQDFGIYVITRESLKTVKKCAAKYFTHEESYYPVPQTCTEFADVNFMLPLPSEEIKSETESAMKKILGEVSSVEAKDSLGGNHQK